MVPYHFTIDGSECLCWPIILLHLGGPATKWTMEKAEFKYQTLTAALTRDIAGNHPECFNRKQLSLTPIQMITLPIV